MTLHELARKAEYDDFAVARETTRCLLSVCIPGEPQAKERPQ